MVQARDSFPQFHLGRLPEFQNHKGQKKKKPTHAAFQAQPWKMTPVTF